MTLVAVYDTELKADAAVHDLIVANVPEAAISVSSMADAEAGDVLTSGSVVGPVQEVGLLSGLFGSAPAQEAVAHEPSVGIAFTVVSVDAPVECLHEAVEILEQSKPIDIESSRATARHPSEGPQSA